MFDFGVDCPFKCTFEVSVWLIILTSVYCPDDLENKYDGVTLNMIIAVVQAVGFFNSFNNPIVYAFMNENFKKSCVSTLSKCIRKRNQQRAAAVAPRLSVQFIKPQSREAFPQSDEGNSSQRNSAEKAPASSSHGESSL